MALSVEMMEMRCAQKLAHTEHTRCSGAETAGFYVLISTQLHFQILMGYPIGYIGVLLTYLLTPKSALLHRDLVSSSLIAFRIRVRFRVPFSRLRRSAIGPHRIHG